MKFRNLILIFVILLIPNVNALPFVDSDDSYLNHGNTDDGIVWGGFTYSIDFGANNMPADSDAVCFDWDGDLQYEECYFHTGVDQFACDNFDIFSEPDQDVVPLSTLFEGNCDIRTDEACDHFVDHGNDGDKWKKRAWMSHYIDCGGAGETSGIGTPRTWYVISPKKADCDGLADDDYQIEGQYASNSWVDLENVDCASNKVCDEDHDDVNEDTPTGSIDSPCRTKNGFSCSDPDDCLSNNCVDGTCQADLNCNSNQCANDDLGQCQNDGQFLPTGSTPQYACDAPDLSECSSSDNTPCKNVHGYSCTFDNSKWAWRSCIYGCDLSTQKCADPLPEICIDTDTLVFKQ